MLRFGPAAGPVLVAANALFEEGNRTRALLVAVLRQLAARGIAGALPDLPAQGESTLPTVDARLASWRQAFAAAVDATGGQAHVLAIRGGALVDGEAAVASRWYLSPQSGNALVRELRRLRKAGGGTDYAGNLIHDEMIAALDGAEPATLAPLRVVRLADDPRAADARLTGAPPWRAIEPVADLALAAAIADDVAAWIGG